MPQDQAFQPPVLYRWLVLLASCIVPRLDRPAWRTRRATLLFDWWVLMQRGELPRGESEVFRLARAAFTDALKTRVREETWRRWLHGPAVIVIAAVLVAAATAVLSHGFTYTRYLLQLVPNGHGPKADTLIGHGFLLTLSLIAGATIVFLQRLPLRLGGWLYRSFLLLKILCVVVMVPLIWIETSAAVRNLFPGDERVAVLTTIALAWAYVSVLGVSLAWCVTAQRHRCPVCLRMLGPPVTIGSWASIFEPCSIEMLCEDGHGTLQIAESFDGQAERWTTLDDSWRDLFTRK